MDIFSKETVLISPEEENKSSVVNKGDNKGLAVEEVLASKANRRDVLCLENEKNKVPILVREGLDVIV